MKRKEVIFEEMMTENFLILMSDTKPEIQKAHKRAKRINTKKKKKKKNPSKQKTIPWHLIYKLQKIKRKKMH